jgi:hypothetical protein
MRLAPLAASVVLSALLARPASCAQGQIPSSPQVINLSLMDTLVAIDAGDMAGVFSFIPEDRTSMAMADYLAHNHRALKKFIKKGERDVKEVQGIDEWDRQVVLYLVGITSSGGLPGAKPIPAGWVSRINELALVPAVPLQVIVEKRRNR